MDHLTLCHGIVRQRFEQRRVAVKATGAAVMFDLCFDPSHGAGQPA
ncbi:hypothetical protein [Novosphingobium sp. Chol11]|nr:hypothetical protein [Novosphingobium sp. Chol11]